MHTRTLLTTFKTSVVALCCLLAFANVAPAQKSNKPIKRDDARKLIAALSILELNKAAVEIKETAATTSATATVLASIKLAFRFARDERGAWRVAEVRTGDRRWESFDLLARALGDDDTTTARAALDAFAAELDALAAGKAASGEKIQAPKELKRGALSVKNPVDALTVIGTAASVELEVETYVEFVRDARKRWQATRANVGGHNLAALPEAERALDIAKRERVRADLETLAAALEVYRRERGFYVVGESSSVLVDHLNPRYTRAFIRFDPWHHAYEYEGTRERYLLRSLGADGKPNTPDDVTITKG